MSDQREASPDEDADDMSKAKRTKKNRPQSPGTYVCLGGARRRTQSEMTVVEQAAEEDRVWFEKHPFSRVRLREGLPHEFDADLGEEVPNGYRIAVAVEQLEPGARHRNPLAFVRLLPSHHALTQDQLDQQWHDYSEFCKSEHRPVLLADELRGA
ncbi:hypothetical protein [Mycobacteroides abscessus]|uniref:hypothetical protein n=1 Tax=Mycobacteroides abscessus TaxID=36809 RepID=UPI000D3E9AE7|nr:hypothetical protein [Mycobacteroides abscessus]PVB33000.1 hypothetical protein DDJ45_10200 [Mycobacteroides abscessus]